jgi:hypothetical protein
VQLQLLKLTVILALLGGVIYGLQRLVFERPQVPRILLSDARGRVDRRNGGREEVVHVETPLALGDAVRTGPSSRATLALPSQTQVVLGEETEAELQEFDPAVQTILLRHGSLRAEVPAVGRRVLRVEAEGARLTVESIDGEFSVQLTRAAEALVRCSRGEVWHSHGGWPHRLLPGEEFRTLARTLGPAIPADRAEIPSSVILKASWPKPTQVADGGRRTGETAVGAVVSVGGVSFETRPRNRITRAAAPPVLASASARAPPAIARPPERKTDGGAPAETPAQGSKPIKVIVPDWE